MISNSQPIVSLAKCDTYDEDEVSESLKRALNLIGGIRSHVRPDSKVLIKPNLLMGADPSRAVCTHPVIISALIRLLSDLNCQIIIADSPGAGIPYTRKNLIRTYQMAGYESLGHLKNVTLNLDTTVSQLSNPDGKIMKKFEVISPILSVEAVIVVSKLKTHIYTQMTGATKNLFGVIPGLDKPTYHARFQDEGSFGSMLVDLNQCIKPVLQIMDAIDIMEGDGPMAGTPNHLGVILASNSPYALDMVASTLIGYDPLEIGYIRSAFEQGFFSLDSCEIRGDLIENLKRSDIKKPITRTPGTGSVFRKIGSFLFRKIGLSFTLHPTVDKSLCIRCGKCMRACPVEAIIFDRYPNFNLSTCIRCYCCHEMCDSHAIRLKPGILLSLASLH